MQTYMLSEWLINLNFLQALSIHLGTIFILIHLKAETLGGKTTYTVPTITFCGKSLKITSSAIFRYFPCIVILRPPLGEEAKQ